MLLEDRLAQIVPTLTAAQIQFALRFASGPERRFAPDEKLLDVGDRDMAVWLVVEGSIVASRRDGLGREGLFATGGPGQFSGEVSDLAGHASLAMVCAGPDGCTAYPFDLPHLRALLISSADIGELMMRAFILRRAALLEGDSVGSVILGEAGSPATVRLRGLLTRNSYPHSLIDSGGTEGKALVERLGVQAADLPILICPNGTVLRRPSDTEAGVGLGIVPDIKSGTTYDVIVVGAGPAGLAVAVYAASEGLSVLVIDSRSLGGQAGASSRIENYLGFPTGITGQALTARAFLQAQKFGAQFAMPISVVELDCAQPPLHRIALENGVSIYGRTVVIASGARYRRPEIENLDRFEAASVSYWATTIEATLCEGRDIVLVGGGNSAGQAAVFLAAHARQVHLAVRSSGLDDGIRDEVTTESDQAGIAVGEACLCRLGIESAGRDDWPLEDLAQFLGCDRRLRFGDGLTALHPRFDEVKIREPETVEPLCHRAEQRTGIAVAHAVERPAWRERIPTRSAPQTSANVWTTSTSRRIRFWTVPPYWSVRLLVLSCRN